MKTLGIIGGMGPQATVYFQELVTNMTQAANDQEHIPMVLISRPQIPDRTGFILQKSTQNPLPQIIDTGRQLAAMGAQCIAIPCITAHYFHDKMEQEIPVPVINAIERTVFQVKQAQIGSVGILATDGTIQSRIFQDAFEKAGIQAFVPDKNGQLSVMELIYDTIKAGRPLEAKDFLKTAEEMKSQGARLLILGCTELSLLKKEKLIGDGYLDVMEILAQEAVKYCGRLRKEYEQLI